MDSLFVMHTSRGSAYLPGVVLALVALIAGAQDSLDRDYGKELPRIEPLSVADAIEQFEVHPDFRIECVASEPLVRDPIAMDFDAHGNLYVVEMRGYSEQRDEHLGGVRRLTDTDGDGRFDRATTLVGGLAWPTALLCYDGGVYIGAPPDILYCKDTDNDGVADEREVVFTGFGLSNVQGLLNSFRWGIDNRIHGATSSSGAEVRPGDDPAALPIVLRGRDFSFDPRTRDFRPESGGGQHGLTFDERGRKYVCHNSDHAQLVLLPDRFLARNPFLRIERARESIALDGRAADVYRISPVEPWREVRTRLRVQGLVPGPIEGGGTAAGYFTSATGITVYTGDAWPAAYRGNLIIGDVGSNLIHRKIVAPHGVSMRADRARPNTEFVRSRDIWFRPVQFANGPDGALYVADMYREVIEHPDSLPPIIKKHLDLTSGRDRGRIYRIVPKGAAYTARPLPGDADDAALVAMLDHPNGWRRRTAQRLMFERADPTFASALIEALPRFSSAGRRHALYALHSLNALDAQTLVDCLEQAPLLAEHYLGGDPDLVEPVARLARHDDPYLRFQAAFVLGYSAAPGATAALAKLAVSDGDDPWMRHAIMSSAVRDPDGLFAALAGSESALLTPLADLCGAAGGAAVLRNAMDTIENAVADDKAQPLMNALIAGAIAQGHGAVLRETMDRSPRAQSIVANLIAAAYVNAKNRKAATEKRALAAATLSLESFDDAGDTLMALLGRRQPAAVQRAAFRTLRSYRDPAAAARVLAVWPTLSGPIADEVLSTSVNRRAWTAALLDRIEDGSFPASRLDSTHTAALMNHPDETLRARARKRFDRAHMPSRAEVVEAYGDVLTLEGDAIRGAALFAEHCSVCHQYKGKGHVVGPDLSAIGQGGPEKILVNVLDPNREVNPQYESYTVESTDWETYSGIISAETATGVTLTRANGIADTVLRVNIESIASDRRSLMPEGWEESLGREGLADIVAYLMGGTGE